MLYQYIRSVWPRDGVCIGPDAATPREGTGVPVGDIISFDDKVAPAREKKAAVRRKEKALAVRRVFQCTGCAHKCEKCGTPVEPPGAGEREGAGHPLLPYKFCEACQDEYLDYLERLQGRGDPECYWRNDEWRDAWRKWIDYQGSVDRYTKSKEFQRLLQEFKPS
jgi:hypothetical protein